MRAEDIANTLRALAGGSKCMEAHCGHYARIEKEQAVGGRPIKRRCICCAEAITFNETYPHQINCDGTPYKAPIRRLRV